MDCIKEQFFVKNTDGRNKTFKIEFPRSDGVSHRDHEL